MGQDIFDLVVILFLVFYAIRGFFKGFVVEAASLVSFIAGIWAAYTYYPRVAAYLTIISQPAWRTLAACVILFMGTIILVSLAARVLHKIISFSFVGWADRIAGFCLGLAKGILIVGLIMYVLQKFFADAPFMRNSRVLPYFDTLLDQLRAYLPDDMLSKLGF